MTSATRPRLAWALAALVAAPMVAGGCAPGRHALQGEEARTAAEFFAAAGAVPFPIVASYTGSADVAGRTVPFVAGVNSRGPGRETVGLYDPLGRAVLFLENADGDVSVTRGPAAAEVLSGDLDRFPHGPVSLRWDGFSVGRVLGGAPGFAVSGGEPRKTGDGAWVLVDGPQTLFTDPARRHLARAEYELSGKRVAVSYPGREGSGPPRTVLIEARGTKLLLRRDEE